MDGRARRARGIDCDFRRRASYAYLPGETAPAPRPRRRPRRAGLPPRSSRRPRCPSRSPPALRRPGRVPRPQVPARARPAARRALPALHAVQVDADDAVSSRAGRRVTADHVVVATPTPSSTARSRSRARPAPSTRSCAASRAAAAGHVQAATRRRARSAPCRRRRGALLVGGEGPDRRGRGHRSATGRSSLAREHWNVESVVRWSNRTPRRSRVPYVGPLTRATSRC